MAHLFCASNTPLDSPPELRDQPPWPHVSGSNTDIVLVRISPRCPERQALFFLHTRDTLCIA